MLGIKSKSAPKLKDFKLPDYLLDDAFALRRNMANSSIPKSQSDAHYHADRRILRLKTLIVGLAVVLLALYSLCMSFDGAGVGNVRFYAPWDAIHSLVTWAAASVSRALGLGWFPDVDMIELAPLYPQVVPRAGMTLATLLCGGLLACAGMLYQVVFRNPIASPSLLGVTNGVKVGLLMVFMDFGLQAQNMLAERFIYAYTAGIVTLVAVFVLSKLITKRKSSISVFDMLVIGTIASAFLSAVSKYMLSILSTVDMWILFFEYQEALTIYMQPLTYAVLAASVIVSFVPVFLMRFHLNLLSFGDGEARVMGANPRLLRVLSIAAGSLMILTAQVFVGPASSFALVIPFLARGFFGSEFRQQLLGNALLGMAILLVCRNLCILIPFAGIGIPIGTLAGVVTLPVFIWATLFSKKAWS
ncbi:MAG: iron chelate uptake ABC transporter family permease subunit [Coriobacteriia bacterium]|nr:iron chelate uptake ABC transporter family permease subunit [Coriobacteriia bacterium]